MKLSNSERKLLEKIENKKYPIKNKNHPTASSFVLNKRKDKVLFIYHKKYNSWSWIGGHLEDGETPIDASIRELEEESGLREKPFSKTPILVQKLRARNHFHYDVCYLYIVDEETPLKVNTIETDGISWIPLSKLEHYVTEKHMLPIYNEIIKRSREFL